MAFEFSIERAASRIYDARTREYFDEVKGCYNAGYFRSAIVMLWSVIICDLLYKLDFLANANGDSKAQKILKEIENERKAKPKDPAWELKLVSLIDERTQIFDAGTSLAIQTIQQHRHLSAHPVLKDNDLLYSPTQEVARAHLRDALEGLLTRPPMMSQKIFNSFVEDLAANKTVLKDQESVEKYILSKYQPHLSDTVLCDLFRRIWKLVFKLTDEKCEENRVVNFMALRVFYRINSKLILNAIESEPQHFSDCHFVGNPVKALAGFLRRQPEAYPLLTEGAKVAVTNFVQENLNDHVLAWFLTNDPVEHIARVLDGITETEMNLNPLRGSVFSTLIEFLWIQGDAAPAKRYAIRIYGISRSSATATSRFNLFIAPLIEDFDVSDLESMLQKCEKNPRTYKRGAYANFEVRRQIEKLGLTDFDYSRYPKVSKGMLDDELYKEWVSDVTQNKLTETME